MFKLFKKIKYGILSKIAERKLKKVCKHKATIQIKVIEVRDTDGKITNQIKTEIVTCENDYKKLIDVLLMKGL